MHLIHAGVGRGGGGVEAVLIQLMGGEGGRAVAAAPAVAQPQAAVQVRVMVVVAVRRTAG